MADDKELLIRIRADIRHSLAELKKVAAELRNTEKESKGSARAVDGLGASINKTGRETRGSARAVDGLGAAINKTGKEAQGTSRAVDGMGASTARASRDTSRLVQAQQSAARSSTLLRDAMAAVAAAVGAVKIGTVVKDAALLAANVQTLDVVLAVVGRNAGYTQGQMELYTEQVKVMGITSQVAARTVIRMTQAQMDLATASQLARVAQDAAVVGNINSSEALDRLLHGVVSLQPEILRNIGIMVSFEQEYAKFALQADRTVESLTANEKQQIALNAVLREGDKLSGTYADALDTVGKKLGSMARLAETASEELGKLFQPAFAVLVDASSTALNMLAEELRGLNAALGTSGIEDYSLERVDSEIARVSKRLDELFAKDLNFAEFFFFQGSQFVNLDRQLNALLERRRALQQESLKTGFIVGREPPAADANTPPPGPTPEEQAAAREAAERAAKQREEAVRTLEFEARSYGMTAREVALYRLELEGASQAQMARARTALDALDADQAFEAAVRASEDAVKATNLAYNDWLRTLESDAQRVYESTRTAQEQLTASVERYRMMLAAGAIDQETFNRAVAGAEKDFEKISTAGDESFKDLTNAVHGWGREFTDTLADMVMEGKLNFKDLADSIIRDLLRISIYQGITKPLFDSIGGFLPQANTGVAAAAGGYISGPGTATSDSIPARLSDGEYVVRAAAVKTYGASFLEAINQMRLPRFNNVPRLNITRPGAHFASGGLAEAAGAGGEGSVRVVVENKGQPIRATDAQASFDPEGMVVRIITDDVRRGGGISGALERTFGLRRRGGF